MKPVMVDLFCGRGGWTKGFQAHGWHCIGIDLFPQPNYPGEFIQADIAHLIELPPADFYCCSSPCENFSIFGMPKGFHKNPRWPWLGIALFHHAKALMEATGKPFVMENVRCAERFVGQSINHCGPFYLWGSGIPAIFPRDAYRVKKGLYIGAGKQVRTMTREELRETRKAARIAAGNCHSSNSKARKEETARLAEIPILVSSHIAQMAGAL
jgi:hypothetical protein